jgi:type II secretory pathway pseudopilin PulG
MLVASQALRAKSPWEYGEQVEVMPMITLPHLQILRTIAHFSPLRPVAHLARAESGPAFRQTQFLLQLADSLKDEPVIVSLLTRYLVIEASFQPLWEGLVRHQWTDEHLSEFEEQLSSINLLAHFQMALRGERVVTLQMLQTFKSWKQHEPVGTWPRRWVEAWPRGWLDQSAAIMGRAYQEMIDTISARECRIDVKRSARFPEQLEELLGSKWNPRFALARAATPIFSRATQRCTYGQATIHLARIAVALERHRLRHGSYPEVLAALDRETRPTGDKLPHDPATGRPPRYSLTQDGTFKLYYDGWNGTDDGGNRGVKASAKAESDPTQGDWLWPHPAD